jgi:uncharacterized protein (DUF1697 family)
VSAAETALARKAETAMTAQLGQPFFTIVRSVDVLRQLIEADPYAAFMTLSEKNFGKNVTTRTWETVKKCVAA